MDRTVIQDNAILLTCWHTGTKYFLEGLERHHNRATYSHLNDTWRRKADQHEHVYTTYRDPLEVAASWGNRGHFASKNTLRKWCDQWRFYQELQDAKPIVLKLSNGQDQHGIKFAEHKINSHPDDKGLHKAIANNNLDTIYQVIPKKFIDLAYECSEWAR
jgi:hypothetical protein